MRTREPRLIEADARHVLDVVIAVSPTARRPVYTPMLQRGVGKLLHTRSVINRVGRGIQGVPEFAGFSPDDDPAG
jgi:hypothetical protein